MATYNPQDHIVSNKGFGVLAKPVDARSWWTDGIEQRPFASKAEVLAYFPTADSRKGNFLVYIGSEAYTFRGPADADLIPFITQDVDSEPVEGSTRPLASGYLFGKEFGKGGLTFTDGRLFAGEVEVNLNLEYFGGIWKKGAVQQGWLVVSTDRTKLWKAKRNHDSQAEPAAGNDWELLLEVLKVDQNPVPDSPNGIASGYVAGLEQKLAYFQNNQLLDAAGNAITLSVPMDSAPVKEGKKPVESAYFFTLNRMLPRYDQAEKVWRDWQGNVILQIDGAPKPNSIYPVESGWLYTQMQRQVYYQNGRLQDFLGNDIPVGSAGNAVYFATPKVYGSVEQLQALPYTEKVLGASYKVYDGTQGYTYEYRKTGEGEQVTIPTQVAQLRIGTETYENGVLSSLSTVNGAKYALLEGTFNQPGSVYLRVVASGSSYVPDTGAQPETFEQVVYANPEQPPVNGQRTVYSFTQTTATANLTYAPGVYAFVDITTVAGDWITSEQVLSLLGDYLQKTEFTTYSQNYLKSLPGYEVGKVRVLSTDANGNFYWADSGGTEPANTPPSITLLGDNPMFLTVGEPYVEPDPSYTATDAEDGPLTAVITGTVDTSQPGENILTYAVIDSGGLTATVDRAVIVQAVPTDPTAPPQGISAAQTGPNTITLTITE